MLTEEGTVQIEKATPLQRNPMTRIAGIEKALVMRVSKNRDRYRIRYQKYAKDKRKEEYLGRS